MCRVLTCVWTLRRSGVLEICQLAFATFLQGGPTNGGRSGPPAGAAIVNVTGQLLDRAPHVLRTLPSGLSTLVRSSFDRIVGDYVAWRDDSKDGAVDALMLELYVWPGAVAPAVDPPMAFRLDVRIEVLAATTTHEPGPQPRQRQRQGRRDAIDDDSVALQVRLTLHRAPLDPTKYFGGEHNAAAAVGVDSPQLLERSLAQRRACLRDAWRAVGSCTLGYARLAAHDAADSR